MNCTGSPALCYSLFYPSTATTLAQTWPNSLTSKHIAKKQEDDGEKRQAAYP